MTENRQNISSSVSRQSSTVLLIGLGNPGKKYAHNRHNAGFMAIDAVRARYRFSEPTQKFNGFLSEGSVEGQRVLAFCPLSFMNLSGQPAGELARFYKIPPEQITVFHDELDLPLGKIRVKRGGGHGGHNGLKSLDAHVGAEYQRVRIGIGHPGDKNLVHAYVLNDYAKEEWPQAEKTFGAIAEHLPLLLTGDEAGFMNKLSLDKKENG